MKRYVFAGAAFCLVVGFQNCARNQASDSTSSDALSNPTQVTAAEKVDVAETSAIQVPESAYLESQLQPIIEAAQPTATFASHHLQIDARTGVISVYDQNNDVVEGVQFCMTMQNLQQLTTVLNSAQICQEASTASNSNTECSMDYTYPYAQLQVGTAEIALGESTSGCQKGPDLCGTAKDALQQLLGNVESTLAAEPCNFQTVGN